MFDLFEIFVGIAIALIVAGVVWVVFALLMEGESSTVTTDKKSTVPKKKPRSDCSV